MAKCVDEPFSRAGGVGQLSGSGGLGGRLEGEEETLEFWEHEFYAVFEGDEVFVGF